MIDKYFRKKGLSQFASSSLTMISGTLISQIIPLLSSLVLARIYSPESFGVYAVFLTYLNVGIVLINLRYELAIVKESSLKGALKLFQGSLIISISLTAISYLLIAVSHTFVPDSSYPVIWLVPIGCLLNGTMLLFINLSTKLRKFVWISWSKIAQSLSVAITSILIGYLSESLFGLVHGYLIGFISFIAFNTYLYRKYIFHFFRWREIKNVLKKHIDFPKYNVFSSLLNAIGLSIPVWYLSWQFDEEIVGYYGLAQRIVVVPLMLISASISQVVYEKAVASINNNYNLNLWLKKFSSRLLLVYILPCLILFLFSESIFAFAFGEDWRVSGLITKYIIFGFLAQVFLTPFSMIYPAFGKLKLFMGWQFFQFIFSLITVITNMVFFDNNLYTYLILFSIGNVIIYSSNYFIILKVSSKSIQ